MPDTTSDPHVDVHMYACASSHPQTHRTCIHSQEHEYTQRKEKVGETICHTIRI